MSTLSKAIDSDINHHSLIEVFLLWISYNHETQRSAVFGIELQWFLIGQTLNNPYQMWFLLRFSRKKK